MLSFEWMEKQGLYCFHVIMWSRGYTDQSCRGSIMKIIILQDSCNCFLFSLESCARKMHLWKDKLLLLKRLNVHEMEAKLAEKQSWEAGTRSKQRAEKSCLLHWRERPAEPGTVCGACVSPSSSVNLPSRNCENQVWITTPNTTA